jgi:protein TonB
VRKPAADEVAPWVLALIKRASPFPAPRDGGGTVTFTETFFVDKSGLFQAFSLTEGQR